MKSKDKRFTYTKILTTICIIVFCICIYKTFTLDYSTITDTAAIVCALTVSGGITGACIKYYMNKSQSENIPRIQTGVYKDTMQIRLEYNEKMMQLQKKYMLSNEEICDIESQSNIDEISDTVLDSTLEELNTSITNAHKEIEIETI